MFNRHQWQAQAAKSLLVVPVAAHLAPLATALAGLVKFHSAQATTSVTSMHNSMRLMLVILPNALSKSGEERRWRGSERKQ
jgi:hypothetical protein